MKNLLLGTLLLAQFVHGTEDQNFKTENNSSNLEPSSKIEIKKDNFSNQNLNDKFEITSQELTNFKEEILSNKNRLNSETISKKIQNFFPKNVLELILAAQTNSEDNFKTLEQAYTHRNNLLTDIVNEINKRNHQIRKEIEKRKLLIRIFLVHSERIEQIQLRSSDICNITDISERYNTVKNQYNKLVIIERLLGRNDLGIKAKPSDLSIISKYLDKNTDEFPSKEFDILVDQFNVFVDEIKGQ